MSATQKYERLDRPNLDLLGRALLISLALHLLIFGAYQANHRYHWLDNLHLPKWLERAHEKLAFVKPIPKRPPPADDQPPLMFVEVSPTAPVTEPPKKSKYYSSRSSKAANPDADAETDTPKISGSQSHVPKTEDASRSTPQPPAQPQPLQPTPPQPEQAEPEAKPKPVQTPGDLAMAKPETKLRESDGQAEKEQPKPRPRTLAEAQARQASQGATSMPGEKMKQAGGVRARAISSLDVTATPFGAYDAAVIAAIQSRWYALLDSQPLTRTTGKVTLAFHLNYDGSITDMKVVESTVSGLLSAMCQRAILDPAPFGVWPSDMRRMIGANFRDVTFTFYYY